MPVRNIAWSLLLYVAQTPLSLAYAQANSAPDPSTAQPQPPSEGGAEPGAQDVHEVAERDAASMRGATQRPATAAFLLRDDKALATWVAQHSPDVSAARYDRDAASASARGARLLPNPVLDLALSNIALGQTNPAGLSREKTHIYGVGISELVEINKRSSRIDAADLQRKAAEQRLHATLAERVAAARLALAQLVYARSRAQELDASLTQARAAAAVAKGRLDHQALSGVDYDRLLIDLAGIETESAHAHADQESARAQCAATLLAPCDDSETTVAALEPAASVPQHWEPKQLSKRADIQAIRYEGSAASSEAELAAARAVPDLTFRIGYTRDVFTISGDLAHSLSVSVSAPLPAFDRGQHDKSAALAKAGQFAQQARSALNHAQGDVTALYLRKQAVEGALTRLETDSLPRANGVLEAEERGLHEGQLDITDLLLVRREAIALRLQTLDLRFELFNLRNQLRQALGLDEALAQR